MVVNVDKTKIMLVHGRQRQGQEQKLNVCIQGRPLEQVNNEKRCSD